MDLDIDPNLDNERLWDRIKTEITNMYSSKIFSMKPGEYLQFKILGNIQVTISGSGFVEVYTRTQRRTMHISDLLGTSLNKPFSVEDIRLPKIEKYEYTSDNIIDDITKIQNHKFEWDFDKYAPWNTSKIPSQDELLDMDNGQIEYYNARMRYERFYEEKNRITPTEWDQLYMNSFASESDKAIVDYLRKKDQLSKRLRENQDERERAEAEANFKSDPTLIYEDSMPEGDSMTDVNNENNENNGWHEPVIKYDPNYQRQPQEAAPSPKFPVYAQDTLKSNYERMGRIPWDPNKPQIVGPNGRGTNSAEIAGETHIHASWLEVAKVNIRNKDYMTVSFIPTLRRKLEFEKMVLDRKTMAERHYPSNDLFNQFMFVRYDDGLKRDQDPEVKLKTILKESKKLLKANGFIHMHIHEALVGAATLAKAVMLTLPEEDRQKLDDYKKVAQNYFNEVLNNRNNPDAAKDILKKNPPTFTVKGYIDFDASTYPKYMGEEMTSYHSKVKSSPTDMIYQIMRHNVDMMSNIIRGMAGDSRLEANVYVVNPIEWALDFVRYATERIEYQNATKELDQIFIRDLQADPIYEPLPLRLAVNVAIKFPQDLEYGALPAQVVDIYSDNGNQKNRLTKELWEGTAMMTRVRDLPWRKEIAPQLWDTTFFFSTYVPRVTRKGDLIGHKIDGDPFDLDHRNAIFENFSKMNGVVLAGKDGYTDQALPIFGRKTPSAAYPDTHDELGWYISFHNPSKMEGL